MITIGTWNIGKDLAQEDYRLDLSSYDYIIEILNENKIDVICFQEAITSSTTMYPISTYLEQNSAYKYHYDYELAPSSVDLNNKIGISVCSKYPITDGHRIPLQNPKFAYTDREQNKTYRSEDDGFIIAKIPNFSLMVVTGHCPPFDLFHKKPTECLEIFTKLEQQFGYFIDQMPHLVFCGDFNMTDTKLPFAKMNTRMIETVQGPTYQNKHYDHMFVDKQTHIIDTDIIPTEMDHNMCIVTLNIEEAE